MRNWVDGHVYTPHFSAAQTGEVSPAGIDASNGLRKFCVTG
jgi:hypothetical protein